MDGPRDYHTQWSKSDRERQIPYVITYVWNLGYDTNEPVYKTKQKQTRDLENSVVVAKTEGGEGGKDWEFEISRCKL